ncbi:lipopolysaccharide/colanic/teichoic acid biosynthesis glycosyltransferase [Roseovarius halotolerans]|uniref:Undecaprenyl phosphate N,N'-diacetylbacillosamine 1-phosphate transferase n=1 Tax=Roseovarius halotolerans TaxID=505353 RepID=A0A1X6YJR1_9RHOB|nr:sugar transferase [Roseovarius halotolerans]RKT34509.1 lipopolysaccharide/colanic/teichoic acid biosynthesis glycosyltransferase [Roseovarius halotolerans]THF93665.1 MAG: sugar transferase [Sulfitobacter sp. SK025]SLN22467.1 Undecaprenyl phosphate N,N'-diacetylbacillosamine 1-phosphate transferase [Roseovarius halotolerans]
MALSEIIFLTFGCLGAVVVGVVTKVLADDAKLFIPRIAQNLLRRASLKLGEEYAAGFYEEWSAHLIEIPETSGKLWHAATIYFWGAYRIRQTLCPAVGATARQRIFKRILDIVFVGLSFPSIGPIVLLFAVLVALDGKSPFYSQMRVGQNGRTFRIWKLRTMFYDADKRLERYLERNVNARLAWTEYRRLRSDPRITKIGWFLRKTSLDELPQLWNVLNGTMSLVGPRPLLIEQQRLYDGEAYYKLRPGITGLWQISRRLCCDFKYRERLDDEYFKQQSLWTDIKIMLATCAVVCQKTGA